jgi:hypothetical protein
MRASPVGQPPRVRPSNRVVTVKANKDLSEEDEGSVERRTFFEEFGSSRFVYGSVHYPIDPSTGHLTAGFLGRGV